MSLSKRKCVEWKKGIDSFTSARDDSTCKTNKRYFTLDFFINSSYDLLDLVDQHLICVQIRYVIQ